MGDGVYVALSGAIAQEAALENTAQNLANASSPGFQRSRIVFAEVLSGAGQNPQGVQGSNGRYTQVATTKLDTTAGALQHTGRDLDAALPEGNYLAVATPRGERYSRAVHLDIAVDGKLTSQGLPVATESGQPITVSREGGPVTLSKDGEVMQDGAAVGRLRVVSFTDPSMLQREGGNLVAATAASGPAAVAEAQLQVGALEQANTQTVSAMTDLVSASRAFEAFQRALDAFRDADRRVVSTVPG